MISLDIRDDFKEAAKAYELLLMSKDIEQAIARALNKAITAARTDSVKEVGKVYKTRAKDIRRTFKIRKAFGSNLRAELVSTGKLLPAYGFMSRVNTSKTAGASVDVKGQSKTIAGSFLARVPSPGDDASMHIGLFVRTGKFGLGSNPKRERIRELFTMSVPQALGNKIVEESVDKSISERLPDLIIHELDLAVMVKSGAVKLGKRA